MKSEELELDIVKRKNREMAAKLQIYRSENQNLKACNAELNEWLGNLSEVFSIVSASWESLSILEETLLNFMKKRSDGKDKTLLRKYQFHFKNFADIINNLSDKIKNKGHSEEATQNAKQQLRSFVKNYELIFSEMLESYFKFNDDYAQYLTNLQTREDVKEQFRALTLKSFENVQKNKEFQTYFESLKKNFVLLENYNNDKLLEGVVIKKEQQIETLRERNSILERRIKVIFDFNLESVDFQLNCKDEDFDCRCGGAQLTYLKKNWQEKLKAQNSANQISANEHKRPIGESDVALLEKITLNEQEKQNLITRNTLLLEKISKMNSQFRLTEEMILKSSVYGNLKEQCQSLLDYISQLLMKLRKQQEYLTLIERARDQQLREVKKRFEKSILNEEKSNGTAHLKNPQSLFKSQAATLIKQMTMAFQQLTRKQSKEEQGLRIFKEKLESLKKSNQQLNRKVSELQNRDISKLDAIEFKYEKFKEIEIQVCQLLKKQIPRLSSLWEEFIVHYKSRDKKVGTLQSSARKKDKQIGQKIQIQQMMRASLCETEKIYIQNKQALSKTEGFFQKFQSQLARLSQENYNLQYQLEQDKRILLMRLKAETEARNRLEEKISVISKIEDQFAQAIQAESKIQQEHRNWLEFSKKALQNQQKQVAEKQVLIKNLQQESNEKQRQLQKLQSQKENLRSEVRQIKNKLDNMTASSQNQVLRIELDEYKGKIMCSCTGDRQRQVVLKTCPHLFCKRCIEDTTNNRNRKCPLCGIRFTKTDVHEIKWN